jgi:hypothetical protein
MGVAGLAALAGGLVVLAHLRRRGPVVRGQGERP